MTPDRPNFKCPNCDGRLDTTTDPNAFKCQRCGQLTKERPRTATINRCPDGTVLGVAFFLSKTGLEALGIDTTETDVVTYYVVDGTLRFHESKGGNSDD